MAEYISNEITEIKPGGLINLSNPKNLKPRYVVSLSLEFYDTPAKYLVTINGDTGNVVPADDMEPVIHCKNCTHSHPEKGHEPDIHCEWWDYPMPAMGFCSKASKKENKG